MLPPAAFISLFIIACPMFSLEKLSEYYTTSDVMVGQSMFAI